MMLCDVNLRQPPGVLALVTAVISDGQRPTRLQRGVYQCGDWSFDHRLGDQLKEQWPELPEGSDATGVADSPEQVLERVKGLDDPARLFCVSVVKIERTTQPADGGWRWHKWGTYIGDQNPQYEYLYQEKAIDTVYTYHVYELDPNVVPKPKPEPADTVSAPFLERTAFHTVGKLREALAGLPDDMTVYCQVVGQHHDSGAWSMFGEVGEMPHANPRKLVLSLSHPDLPVLPMFDHPRPDPLDDTVVRYGGTCPRCAVRTELVHRCAPKPEDT